MPSVTWTVWPVILAVTVLVAALVLVVSRSIRLLFRAAGRRLGSWLPRRLAITLGHGRPAAAHLGPAHRGPGHRVLRGGQRHVLHSRRGHQRGRRADDVTAPIGGSRIAGGLGRARPAGSIVRRHRSDRRGDRLVQRWRRGGTGAGLRRAEVRAHAPGPRRPAARGAQAHRCLRPQGARRRDDDRHRLPRPQRRRPGGVRVQRGHRDRGRAVLVPAELDLAAGRPGGGAGDLAGGLPAPCTSTGRRCP